MFVVLSLNHVQLFCNPMDCSLPGSSVHGIFQARIPEWVTISFSRGSSQTRDWLRIFCIGRQVFLQLSQPGKPCFLSYIFKNSSLLLALFWIYFFFHFLCSSWGLMVLFVFVCGYVINFNLPKSKIDHYPYTHELNRDLEFQSFIPSMNLYDMHLNYLYNHKIS